MRRICRFNPWVRMIRNVCASRRVTLLGLAPRHDFDAARHHAQRKIRNGAIDRHHVFLFVIIFRSQDLIDDVAIVRQQYQPF